MCVEVVLDWVVVCRGGNNDEVSVAVCLGAVECGGEVELIFSEVALDVIVLDG